MYTIFIVFHSVEVCRLDFVQLTNIASKKTSSNPSWFYNNSGNSFPDYRLTLTEAVGEYTHMGVDFKFTKKGRGNYDILKGCSDNLEYHVRNLSRELKRNVGHVGKNSRITEKDNAIAKQITEKIEKNSADYPLRKDVNYYVLSSNGLRETFSDFFIRNKTGVNLIVPISVDGMSLDLNVKQKFSKTFNHFYLSEDSSFLNVVGPNQNTSIVDTKEIMLSYAKEFFSDFIE